MVLQLKFLKVLFESISKIIVMYRMEQRTTMTPTFAHSFECSFELAAMTAAHEFRCLSWFLVNHSFVNLTVYCRSHHNMGIVGIERCTFQRNGVIGWIGRCSIISFHLKPSLFILCLQLCL